MNSPVYAKTAKGLAKLTTTVDDLPRTQLRALNRIDGTCTLEELTASMSGIERSIFLSTVNLFEQQGMIHVITEEDQPADLMAAIEVVELSAKESELAWSSANQHQVTRRSEPTGFQTNPARLGQARQHCKTGHLHILVVDDDEAIVKLLRLLLEEKGYKVSSATDSAGVIAALNKAPAPDLLLLDVVLPSYSGFSILKNIRHTSSLSSLPVILLSGQTGTDSVAQGLSGGADAYIFKPFKWQSLYGCIQAVTGV